MKINLKKYLLYSSVFAIFTEAFFFNYIIDWKLLYLIIFINYFVLILCFKSIKINIYFKYIIGFLFLHGVICYSIIEIPPNYMLSQILGITIVGLYFYNFVLVYEKEEIINAYLKIVLVVAVIGYPLYFLNINLNDGTRLQSIFKEPAHYVVVVIPACYYFLKTKKYIPFFVVFGTLVLSNSSLGYIGCGLIFLLPNLTLKRVVYLAATIPIITVSFIYTYNEHPFFKMRVDDTFENLKVINTGKFKEDTNLSSYIILANVYIMKQNVSDHPLGSGIGSHHYMHTTKYIKEIRPPKYIRTIDRYKDNSFDANSLFNRMCSEFGVLGIVFIIFILTHLFKVFGSDLYFSQGVVIYILLKLFRDGHYFPPELYLFIWLLYFDIKPKKNKINEM